MPTMTTHELHRLEQCLQQIYASRTRRAISLPGSSPHSSSRLMRHQPRSLTISPAAPAPGFLVAAHSRPLLPLRLIAGIFAIIGLNRPENRAGNGVTQQARAP